MGLFNFIKGELIDVIEWTDSSANTIVWRFPDQDHAIKMGAQLTVRESQLAVFVNEGNIADVFGPGRYELQTQNIPIMTKIMSWPHGFNSPFKAEVYFINTKQFIDQKWGTSNPVMMRDRDFGMIRLRGYGIYSFKVVDPVVLLREIFGTSKQYTLEAITGQLKRMILSGLTDVIAEAGIPALDLATKYDELSSLAVQALKPKFEMFGLDIISFFIENLSLPPEVEEMIDKKTKMGIVGNMQDYAQFQMADNIDEFATKNGGGGNNMADMGVGLAMGNMMGNMMTNMMNPNQSNNNNNQSGGPPPIPGQFYIAVNGQQQGPMDINSIQTMIKNRQIDSGTLAWKQGMANWTPVKDIPELAGLFNQGPPPIPPSN